MNRTLQPIALIVAVMALAGVRLLGDQNFIRQPLQNLLSEPAPEPVSSHDPRVQALEERISQLEAELDFKRSSRYPLISANVLSKTSASFRQLLIVDVGSADLVTSNSAVLADGYLIGVVTDVQRHFSTVTLLGDPTLSVPIVTSGADGIATAKAGGLVVDQLNDSQQAVSGQLVATSGLGGLYPPGLVVGSLGDRLSSDILSQFILVRPFNLSDVSVVQVGIRP